ncbi:MAG TPA: non-homologous end-joining DNA ligase [Solirubrobacterales bacterium]|jgi:bifunctional non-homologous end joining protein LigD|nr:non-homologous end-joining DNA ligase [Solirubrobacterales bacterium]
MAKLSEYERRRDFGKTAEPAPRKRSRKREGAPRFVVQQHDATRLHWDLRLEHDGVGVSWAVPNGIPRDPEENRKAVHTEDHPLEYMAFEGEIPKGEYGAGTVEIWDSGTYELEKWRDDEIIFSFDGERLHGRYVLFRAGGPKDWMIHRMDPAEGDPNPFPDPFPPMLANAGELPRSTRGWAAELAWGGVRAIARCRPGRLELRDADLSDIGARWPEVHRLSRQVGAHDAVLDGELVVFDADGRPDPERLAKRDKPGSDSAVRRRAREVPATFVIFDLLFLDGEDLTAAPYRRRRELLAGLGLEGDAWRVPRNSTTKFKELLAASAGQGVEGLVLKRQASAYAPGRRTGDWLLVRTDGGPDAGGGGGSAAPRAARGRRAGSGGTGITAAAEPIAKNKFRLQVGDRELTVSNLDKVLYPAVGFTKGDLIDAYADLAEVLLPHLRGRPVTLKRYPDGVEGKFFYEKRSPKHRPEWVVTARIYSESHKAEIDYTLIEDLPSLLWSANLANIELHTSLARIDELDRPDSLVFDLDPGAPADIVDCARVALRLRGLFTQLDLDSFAKTSGSKGIHLHLPLGGTATFAESRPFAKAVAETFEARFPDEVVSRQTKTRRDGRVLIDWSQNDSHKTTACVYTVRAKERPTASTPLEWDEVEAAAESGDARALAFTVDDLRARIAAKGDLYAPLLSQKQDLPALSV